MRRFAALITKEIAQHAAAWLGLAAFMAMTWGLLALSVLMAPATVTYLEAHATFLRGFLTLEALALGNRLVVAEWHARTQLFLEALPLGRYDVLVTKLVLGAVVLLGMANASLFATLIMASTREPIELGFVLLLFTRTSAYVLWLWSFLFVMGLLGKLRFPAYLAIGLFVGLLASQTDLEIARFGPFALVDQHLPLERAVWPWEALAWSAGLTLAHVGIALALVTVREGSIAEALSSPMSQRDKAAFGIFSLAALFAVGYWSDTGERPPFSWPEGALVLRSERAPIEVFYARDAAREDATHALSLLEGSLAPLGEALGWDALPTVRVALRESLDGETLEPVAIRDEDGVLVRANFRRTSEWDEVAFVADLVHGTIDEHTDDRATFEPAHWALDGFSRWWAARARPDARARWRSIAAIAARRETIDGALFRRWASTEERLGDPVASAIAFEAIRALDEGERGEVPVRLARALFSERAPEDSRVVITTWLRPPESILREHGGVDLDALAARVRERLASEPASPIDGARASLSIEAHDGDVRDLVVSVDFGAGVPEGTVVSVGHLETGPFDRTYAPWDLERSDVSMRAGHTHAMVRVPGRYGPGQRVLVVADVRMPGVGATVRVLAERRVIE